MTAALQPDQKKIDAILAHRERLGDAFPRYAVFIVAYAAMERLQQVLRRIPPQIYDLLTEVYIFDDFSPDETYDLTRAWLERSPMEKVSLYRNPRNYGYGGNQKAGLPYAIGQGSTSWCCSTATANTPRVMPDILPPWGDDADAVFGSRMMERGRPPRRHAALQVPGQPHPHRFENALLGPELTECHSGYRAYSVRASSRSPSSSTPTDFHFDTQIIMQCHEAGKRIWRCRSRPTTATRSATSTD